MKVEAVSALLLIGLAIATGQSSIVKNNSTTCFRDGDTFRCPGLVADFNASSNYSCNGGYFKLNLKVVEVKGNDDVKCASVEYNITCSTVREKQESILKQEMCRLVQKNITKKVSDTKSFSLSNGRIYTDETSGVSISAVAGAENMTWLIAIGESVGGPADMLDLDGTLDASYDQYYVSPNSVMTFLSGYHENEADASATFNLTIPMDEGPLSPLPRNVRIISLERLCVFLNESQGDKWDYSNCTADATYDNMTVCSCKHNSAFVVAFAVQTVEIAPELMWASNGLEIASIVVLIVAVTLLIVYRKRMRHFDRVLVQINLCLALMLTHFFFVIGPYTAAVGIFCKATAVAAHYFLVVTAFLMVMEGTLMLMKILAPNSFNDGRTKKRRRAAGYFIAWGLPMVYVVVCSVLGFRSDGKDTEKNYVRFWGERGSYDYCWINPIYSAVIIAPVGLAIAINIIIAIKLGTVVWQMSKSAEEFKPSHARDTNKASHAGKALRAILILMPILGIPWIIGFFVNTPKPFAMIFATMHVIVNSLQGVLLFLHYVPFNSEMRSVLKRSWKQTVSSIATVTPTVHFVSTSNSTTQNVE